MKFRAAFASTILLALCVGASGQQPSAPNPSVTFQSEVNYVDVDAIVTNDQGEFVGNLSKEDFELREDGKLQKIDMFSTVDIPMVRPARFAPLGRPILNDVRSNRETFAGRVYVIVLDDQNISPMRTAQTKKQAREFVLNYLGANDVAAVTYTSGRTDAVQEFTNEPQLLLAAIDKFTGLRLRAATLDVVDRYYQDLAEANNLKPDSASDGADSGNDNSAELPSLTTVSDVNANDFVRSYRALGVLRTLEDISDYLMTVRGRRKAVLMFSEGIDYPTADLFGTSRVSDVQGAMQDVVTAAARADVNFFTIDPRGLVGMDTSFVEMRSTSVEDNLAPGGNGAMNVPPAALLAQMRLSQDSLRTLAEETGGLAAVNRNSASSAFDQIVKANSQYYVLGYYPPSHPRDGRFHNITLRVKRAGLKVSARKGYASPRGKTPAEKQRDEQARLAREARKGGANNTSAPLRDVMNGPMQLSGLAFSVQAAPFKGTGKEASVALAIELDGSTLQFAQQNGVATDTIELSFFSLSAQGKPQPGTRTELRLRLQPEGVRRARVAGIRANPRIQLAPGRYQIRVGALEAATGRLGSVFYDIIVPDFSKDPLMMSGLLLAVPSLDQTLNVQKDDLVGNLLPGAATGRREFARTDTLALLSEIYDNSTSRQPRQVEVSVRLLSESGQEVYVARDSVTNTADAKKWDIYAYTKQVPLRDIAAGKYLLRVEAQLRGQANAKPAARETLITIK